MTFGQIANIVRDHAIQPAHAIAAGQRNLRPESKVVNPAAIPQGRELCLRIAEANGRACAAILADFRRAQAFTVSL